MLFKRLIPSVILVVGFGSATRTTEAGFVQGVLTGEIDTIDEPIETPAGVGDTITLTYLYDSDTADLIPGDPTLGVYQILSVTLAVGLETVTMSGTDIYSSISIWAFNPISDWYIVRARFPSSFSGMSSPAFVAYLTSTIDGKPLFSDDALPTSLDLLDFERARFSLEDLDMPGLRISGDIDSLEFQVVPEPSAAMLTGVIALCLLRHTCQARRFLHRVSPRIPAG